MCVTPGCHSLPLTGGHTQPAQPFFHFCLTALLGRGENSSRRAGGPCRKEKGNLYCRCQLKQRPEQASRQRCCLSFNSLSVCSTPQKKRDGAGAVGGKSQSGWCLTATDPCSSWKSISVKERSSVVNRLEIFLELKLSSSSQVILG